MTRTATVNRLSGYLHRTEALSEATENTDKGNPALRGKDASSDSGTSNLRLLMSVLFFVIFYTRFISLIRSFELVIRCLCYRKLKFAAGPVVNKKSLLIPDPTKNCDYFQPSS